MQTIDISSLEFTAVTSAFKEYLRSDPVFQDYNFDGSNISRLMNLFGFNTTYQGMYIKMLMDESFVDTAQTTKALISHAKKVGYLAKGLRSSRTQISISVNVGAAKPPYIILDKYTPFTSTSNTSNKFIFTNLNAITIKPDVNGNYTSDLFEVNEGTINTVKFLVDTTIPNQRFVVQDEACDYATISVKIRPNAGSQSFTEFLLADVTMQIDETSKVYFVSATVDGNYELYFGNGTTYGVKPSHNSVVEVTYLSTHGTIANGISAFKANLTNAPGIPYTNINYYAVTVTTTEPTSGGLAAETVSDLQFSIPHHNSRMGRVVTSNDVQAVILSEFRDIGALSVWGGEDNVIKQYGTIFVSAKPMYSDNLSQSAETEIRQLIVGKYGLVGADVVFVNPSYTNIIMTVIVTVDHTKTTESNSSILARMQQKINDYNTNILSKFDVNFYDSNFTANLLKGEYAILSIQNIKTISKNLPLSYGTGSTYKTTFANAITNVKSLPFTYGLGQVYAQNVDGNIMFYNNSDNTLTSTNILGTVDLSTGNIIIQVPAAVDASSITFIATPQYSDINTNNDNIVAIQSATVNVV